MSIRVFCAKLRKFNLEFSKSYEYNNILYSQDNISRR